MDLIQKANKLGYKHYTEFTVEELDNLPLGNSNKQIEYYFIQKWLREKHNLYVIVDTIHTLIGAEVIRVEWKWSITSDKDDDIKCIWNGKETYEQALEEGLYESLKLIP